MNSILADNSVKALREYLSEQLSALYDERESQNIIHELFAEFKHWSRTDLVMNASARISESEILLFHFALKKLKSGEPLQYVLGHAWFAGRKFNVGPDVLIPRPETEELVRHIVSSNHHTTPRILDIGTGSGCIAISLKKEISGAQVIAIDVSPGALEIARSNAKQLDADVEFIKLDILAEELGEKFDIIVSNPPYISESEASSMRTQVVDFEPHIALFTSNTDPLVFYRRIISLSGSHLREGGLAWCEIHEDKKEELMAILKDADITRYSFIKDLQGKDRILQFSK